MVCNTFSSHQKPHIHAIIGRFLYGMAIGAGITLAVFLFLDDVDSEREYRFDRQCRYYGAQINHHAITNGMEPPCQN